MLTWLGITREETYVALRVTLTICLLYETIDLAQMNVIIKYFKCEIVSRKK